MVFASVDMSPDQAAQAILAMRSGDRLIYHIGNLATERQSPRCTGLDQLGKFMLSAGVANGYQFCKDDGPSPGLGLGSLTQRRIGVGVYEYVFTKS